MRFYFWLKLICGFVFCTFLSGCLTTSQVTNSLTDSVSHSLAGSIINSDISQSLKNLISGSEESSNLDEFKKIPFEMAINRSFESELKGKRFIFTAIYKGTVPNPDKYKSVKDFTNLKMCDLNNIEVCSDLIVINTKNADEIFALTGNQPVDVYGTLLEASGFMAGGTLINYNQLPAGSRAPYSHVKVLKILPAGQVVSNNNFSNTMITKTDISVAQDILNQNGYNAGTADGMMGPKTREAIRRYQHDNGLSANGSLDGETLARLKSSR